VKCPEPETWEARKAVGSTPYAAGMLLQEILNGRGRTQKWLSETMGRPAQMVSEIATGKKQITTDTALELERALGVPAEVWLTAQTVCNLRNRTFRNSRTA
jgi:addiction module HigA family antidote